VTRQAYVGLPPHGRGQRIGLFGGSFNPPHEGHRAASLLALRRLQLDWIWWLVTPGNPLKDTRDLKPIAERVRAAQTLADHPRIRVSSVEERLGSPFTCDLVQALKARRSGVSFVWIMGADAFAGLERWRHWRRIVAAVPLAVVDRPGFTLNGFGTAAAGALAFYRIAEYDAARLARRMPPAYVFLHGPRSNLSSSGLRASP
jgi:nicotinate-nucleotide adenylyltransferase